MPRLESRSRRASTGPVNHFLALRPDDDTCERLADAADRLRAWGLDAAWVHPDDYHLTLLFLGRTEDDDAGLLPGRLDEVAGSQRVPQLALAGLSATGGQLAPRAVWAAVRDEDGACAGLHQDLAEVLGVRRERHFTPHLTLCRPSQEEPAGPLFRDWPHALEAFGRAEWGPCTMTELVLWRSSGPGVIRYEALASWPLLP
jgi:2'-5' RNA ligase